MRQGSQLAGSYSKHKGGSQLCQVCLKFILPLVSHTCMTDNIVVGHI
jgi:hypothetical protein